MPLRAGTHGHPRQVVTPAVDGDEDRTSEPAYGIALVTRLPVHTWHLLRLAGAPTKAPVLIPGERAQVILVRDEPRMMLRRSSPGRRGR